MSLIIKPKYSINILEIFFNLNLLDTSVKELHSRAASSIICPKMFISSRSQLTDFFKYFREILRSENLHSRCLDARN